ncbi:DUF4105 domain-containing protein [Winogradskyella sp. R77965]|uniref:lipoprotein N-acyltransferase Lnb domain-containing protein n=1 Tax=Winogradskyella sp. R77965 TaxID=3093872 RepID=UPI0037DCBD26
MKLKFLSFIFFLTVTISSAQEFQLSPESKISVLTIGPGESLNDAFGHNAFRIQDRSLGIDVTYGYGGYDFEAPNFYLKFAQGKLNYLIDRINFSDFHYYYTTRTNRTIEEQILNLSTKEKQKLFEYLENNYRPENRRYLYDFFYDNCATRIRDVAKVSSNNNIEFILPKNFEPKTFRELIHEHVGINTWGSFGIDIALGSVIDRQATATEHMFLPRYIHTFFGSAKLNSSESLVKSSSIIFQGKERNLSSNFIISPLMVMGLLALLILFITFKDYKNNTRSKWLDIILFATTGLVGVLLLLLWFATDHTATAYNYNLLWAFPLNVLVLGQLMRNRIKNWFKGYLKFSIIMSCLLTLHWIIGVQVYAIGLIPVLIALIIRYLYLLRYFRES